MPRRSPGKTWRCEGCGQPLTAARMADGTVGHLVLESDPREGRFVMYRIPPWGSRPGEMQARDITDPEALNFFREIEMPLHVLHEICPGK